MALMLIHRLLADEDPAFGQEIMFASRKGTRVVNVSHFRDEANSNSWDHSGFVKNCSMFLDQKLEFTSFKQRLSGICNFKGDPRFGLNKVSRSYIDLNELVKRGGRKYAKVVSPVREMKTYKVMERLNHAQGACKYGFYEIFNKAYFDIVGEQNATKYKTLIYLVGYASAELIAGIALCCSKLLRSVYKRILDLLQYLIHQKHPLLLVNENIKSAFVCSLKMKITPLQEITPDKDTMMDAAEAAKKQALLVTSGVASRMVSERLQIKWARIVVEFVASRFWSAL
ncbi:putative clathrin assembly protein [Tanacetum coccineum]